VTIKVVTPTNISEKEKELLRELERLHPSNPRAGTMFRGLRKR